jgi:hypothetical protein
MRTRHNIFQCYHEGDIELNAFNVENEFLGVSLTDRNGLNMRRISLEVRSKEDLIALKEVIQGLIDAKMD